MNERSASVGLLGKKIGMTQIFDPEGIAMPVTVVQLGENIVVNKMVKDHHGYEALQIGGFSVKEKSLNKAELGVFKKNNLKALSPLQEFRLSGENTYNVGDSLPVADLLKEGMLVDVRGRSIGKGFQGTVKRFHHGRGPMAHGSKFHRSMGSIGPGTTPGRVYKGLHMPGQMGNEMVCTRHLQVVKLDLDKKLVLLKGSVPGAKGSMVEIKSSKSKWN
jgi:large subunit ribosomal protein L3